MSQIQLYTTYYNEKKEARRQELLTCLENNLNNTAVTSVTVFNEGGDLSQFDLPKLTIVNILKRPTYQDFINHINQLGSEQDLHIIANTDIFFDENIATLEYVLNHNICFALSRWDTTESKQPKLFNKNSSQDVWIFKGPIKKELQADFPLGVPRCDNRFLYEMEHAGYKVLNPAFSIKSYHIHKGQRALVYTEDDNIYKIPPPYRYKYPHNMFGLWQTLVYNATHKAKLGMYRYDIKKLNNWWVIRLPRKIMEVLTKKKMSLIGYK
jgi:hypothetical protein